MADIKYQIDIKLLEKDAPDKGYEAGNCAGCKIQIRKRGPQDWKMEKLEVIARICFIPDPAKEHRVILHYRKK